MKGNTIFAFIGGLLVGAVATLLFPTETIEDTRKKIKTTFNKEYKNLKEKINNLECRTKNVIDDTAGNGIEAETVKK